MKNSAFIVMQDCKCEPPPDNEGALQLSTLVWRRTGGADRQSTLSRSQLTAGQRG